MSDIRKLADNVLAFLETASTLYGKMEAEHFSQNVFCNLIEDGLQSPIEDLFYIALQAQCKAEFTEFWPDPYYDNKGEVHHGFGIFVYPQHKIGKFRVDFLVTHHRAVNDEVSVIVELDGHEFHDKNKQQRSYEKARDRFLQREGYRVFHYTGSDVVADPFAVAYEVLDHLGAAGRESYNANDPLGLGA